MKNKSYSIKWLAVDGEIKPGDTVRITTKGEHLIVPPMVVHEFFARFPGADPVKLIPFLVTDEFEVGDEVIPCSLTEPFSCIEDVLYMYSMTDKLYPMRAFVKVIGQIKDSPLLFEDQIYLDCSITENTEAIRYHSNLVHLKYC